jgi:hypothetical protein
MIKPPFLVALDFKRGTAHRYVRRKDYVVAGLGWQLMLQTRATLDSATVTIEPAVLERFRITGAV